MKINGVVCRIRAEIDGTKYEPGPIKASEGERITSWTGMSVKEWEVAVVSEDDPSALKALICLDQFRRGEHPEWSKVDIDDLDSVTADFYDEKGRLVRAKLDENNKPLVVNGAPVLTFDGEEDVTAPLEPADSSDTQ